MGGILKKDVLQPIYRFKRLFYFDDRQRALSNRVKSPVLKNDWLVIHPTASHVALNGDYTSIRDMVIQDLNTIEH